MTINIFAFKKFLKSFWGGIIITLIILGLGYSFWRIIRSQGVSFSFLGTEEAKAGDIKTFSLILKNDSRVAIQEAEIVVKLPEGVIDPKNMGETTFNYYLGEIKAGDSKTENMELLITGDHKTAKNIEASVRYRPSTLSSFFEKKETKTILISGSAFQFDLVTPRQVFSEQNFPMELRWANSSNYIFEHVEARAEWPTGFVFQDSNPEVSFDNPENNKWQLGDLGAGSEGKIRINGYLSGKEGETKKMIMNLGIVKDNQFFPLAKAENYISLIKNPLWVTTFVNDAIDYNSDLGETLNFVINYQNNYSAALRSLKVTTVFSGDDVFDFSTLRAPRGLFYSRLKTLTWEGSKVPELYSLNPGEKGTLTFSVNLKKDWPMRSLAQKNIALEVQTLVESSNIPDQAEISDLPKASTLNTIKINTGSGVIVESYFRDASSQIANMGKLPLRVDQPTDFTIHWKITNSFNALNDVSVKTTLPLWAEFTNQLGGNYGENPPVYDPNTREVTWNVKTIPAGSGLLAKGYEAVFQVRVTPPLAQLNKAIEIINVTAFRASDSFTQKEISASYPKVMSTQLTDKTVPLEAGIVGL